jgi:hypothetical protein
MKNKFNPRMELYLRMSNCFTTIQGTFCARTEVKRRAFVQNVFRLYIFDCPIPQVLLYLDSHRPSLPVKRQILASVAAI